MGRINVYECPGTDVNASVTGKMQTYTPEQVAASDFCKGLDAAAFNYVFIQGYINNLKPLLASVNKGVSLVVDNINKSSGKFALVGTSQGALIQSLVYKKLKSGEVNRLSDCVGVFLFGNPAREAGKTFPGANFTPQGHGIASSAYRLTDTLSDNLIWEFANPGDPVCTNADGPVGVARELAFNSLLTAFDGTFDSISDILQIAQDLVGLFTVGLLAGPGMALFHCGYDALKPIAGDNRTATQIAIDYLNKVAGPQYRSDGWSTTLVGPSS